ncbi:DUF3561 family protein [Sodalis sp.]|uniref:DUF3561 family protein n=1 Tax=Sodalis sp. (in: enterobacteria) TaxID=1898979 RepID=UPI003872AFFB
MPILQFGAKALFPCSTSGTSGLFLALRPLCVLIGVVFSMLLGGKLWLTALLTSLPVFCLSWLAFSQRQVR